MTYLERIVCPHCREKIGMRSLRFNEINEIVNDYMTEIICRECHKAFQIDIFFSCEELRK